MVEGRRTNSNLIVRPKELTWAALFLVNSCAWFVSGRLEWLPVFLTQLPISILVIAAEIRSPRYHGILAQRWNTNLGDYLEGRIPLNDKETVRTSKFLSLILRHEPERVGLKLGDAGWVGVDWHKVI